MSKRIAAGLAAMLFLLLLPLSAQAEVLFGDANGDGSVDMKDVLTLRRLIAHMPSSVDKTAADVNVDDSVDMKDVLNIRLFLAKRKDALGVADISCDPYEADPQPL